MPITTSVKRPFKQATIATCGCSRVHFSNLEFQSAATISKFHKLVKQSHAKPMTYIKHDNPVVHVKWYLDGKEVTLVKDCRCRSFEHTIKSIYANKETIMKILH